MLILPPDWAFASSDHFWYACTLTLLGGESAEKRKLYSCASTGPATAVTAMARAQRISLANLFMGNVSCVGMARPVGREVLSSCG